jgi:hypothetical protein
MTNNDISDTDYLNALDEETKFMNQGRSQVQRLKIDRGSAARCRFLPVKLGKRGMWFARISHYWVGGRPVLCAKETHPDFGGTDTSDAYYDLIQKYLNDRDPNVQRVARKASPVTQWLTYCLVLETEDSRRRKKLIDDPERYIPHEFWHYRANFTEFMAIFEKRRKKSNLSILDPISGCDLWLTRSNRGMRFERDDPSPICPGDDAQVEQIVADIMSKITFKMPSLPDDEKIDEMCEKLEDDIAYARRHASRKDDDDLDYGATSRKNDRSSSRRSDDYSRRSHDYDDDDDNNDRDDHDDRHSSRSNHNDDRDDDDRGYDNADGGSRRHSRDDSDDSDDDRETRRAHHHSRDGSDDAMDVDEPERHHVNKNDSDDNEDDNDENQRNEIPASPRASNVERAVTPRRVITPPPASGKSVSSVDDDDNVTDEPGDSEPPSVNDKTPPPQLEVSGGAVRKLSASLSSKLAQRK